MPETLVKVNSLALNQIEAIISSGGEAVVKVKEAEKEKDNEAPFFIRVTDGPKPRAKYSKDLVRMVTILKNLSKAAAWVFWTLAEERDLDTNRVLVRVKNFTSKERARYYRGKKELEEKGLIIQEKTSIYFINPFTLETKERNQEIINQWFALGGIVPTEETSAYDVEDN